jgi:hypothetical protein
MFHEPREAFRKERMTGMDKLYARLAERLIFLKQLPFVMGAKGLKAGAVQRALSKRWEAVLEFGAAHGEELFEIAIPLLDGVPDNLHGFGAESFGSEESVPGERVVALHFFVLVFVSVRTNTFATSPCV